MWRLSREELRAVTALVWSCIWLDQTLLLPRFRCCHDGRTHTHSYWYKDVLTVASFMNVGLLNGKITVVRATQPLSFSIIWRDDLDENIGVNFGLICWTTLFRKFSQAWRLTSKKMSSHLRFTLEQIKGFYQMPIGWTRTRSLHNSPSEGMWVCITSLSGCSRLWILKT